MPATAHYALCSRRKLPRLKARQLAWSAVWVCMTIAACKTGHPAHGDEPPPALPPPVAFERKLAWPEPYASSQPWRRAAADPDGLELPRLAEATGAAGLLELVRIGGDLGAVALQAMQYLPDPFASRAELCELLSRTTPASSGPVLDALHIALALGPQSVESLEPAADRLCIASLGSLLQRSDLAEGPRSTAQGLLAHMRRNTPPPPNTHPPSSPPG